MYSYSDYEIIHQTGILGLLYNNIIERSVDSLAIRLSNLSLMVRKSNNNINIDWFWGSIFFFFFKWVVYAHPMYARLRRHRSNRTISARYRGAFPLHPVQPSTSNWTQSVSLCVAELRSIEYECSFCLIVVYFKFRVGLRF